MRLLLVVLAVFASACATTSATQAPPDPEEVTALSKKYMAALDARDTPTVEALLAPQFNRIGRNRFVDREEVMDTADYGGLQPVKLIRYVGQKP